MNQLLKELLIEGITIKIERRSTGNAINLVLITQPVNEIREDNLGQRYVHQLPGIYTQVSGIPAEEHDNLQQWVGEAFHNLVAEIAKHNVIHTAGIGDTQLERLGLTNWRIINRRTGEILATLISDQDRALRLERCIQDAHANNIGRVRVVLIRSGMRLEYGIERADHHSAGDGGLRQ